jgi:hypothetical protein
MLKRVWQTNAPLTLTGLLMLPALAAALVGLLVDPRVITGVPAWLKPAKFAASFAIYTFTLAWVFTFIPSWPKTRRIGGWTTAIVLILELVIIDTQAWRGTTSHFNIGTPLDTTLFTLMGLAIAIQTLASIAVAIALWRERFADRALGWALRLGMTITIVGGLTGGLMTRPTAAQLADARAGHRPAVVGGHTVGAPDGGPGVPGTGWSREHGDLRVAHFVGLHALQILLLLAFASRRMRLAEPVRTKLSLAYGGSYFGLFGILLWQALRGQSILAPDAQTIIVLAIWAMVSAAAAWMFVSRPAAIKTPAVV